MHSDFYDSHLLAAIFASKGEYVREAGSTRISLRLADFSRLASLYGHPLVDRRMVRAILAASFNRLKGLSSIVEMGGGTGYLKLLVELAAHELELQLEYTSFDISPAVRPWSSVQIGGPPLIPMFKDRTLLICWPPPDQPDELSFAFEALRVYTECGGRRLIYIGEPELCSNQQPGYMANAQFFGLLRERWGPPVLQVAPQLRWSIYDFGLEWGHLTEDHLYVFHRT